jgi:cyclohexyl-isocyanide hydratase
MCRRIGMLKRATCHWSALEHWTFLGATPVSERVVVDGNIITGAGVISVSSLD